MWGTGLARADLQALAIELGADVPVFVFGRSALGEGVGERLTALDLPPAWYLVLTPSATLSTRDVFSDNALTRNTKPLKIPPFFPGQGANDLESVAARHSPEIARQLEWLRVRRPAARMTGSGACVFAELGTEDEARRLHGELPGDMRGFVARGLERHPLYEYLES